MPIPALNAHGLLPPGLHECTLEELAAAFGRFTTTDARVHLTEHLRNYCDRARDVDLVEHLVVDGSYVTQKPDPNDVDLIVVLRNDADLGRDLPPYVYNVVSKRHVRKEYPFDVLVAPNGSEAFERHVDYFSRVRDAPGLTKGLLLLRIRP